MIFICVALGGRGTTAPLIYLFMTIRWGYILSKHSNANVSVMSVLFEYLQNVIPLSL